MNKYIHFLKNKKKVLLLSVINAIIILVTTYLWDNYPYSFPGGPSTRQWLEGIKSVITFDQDSYSDSVFIVNIAYDRELIDFTDDDGFLVGNIDITDRRKLLHFLKEAKKANNYKYILLDIHFKDGYNTPIDAELYQTIASMDRIVIPKHKDEKLADSILYNKAHYNDYSATILESGFVKYEYLKNNEYSLPLSIYHNSTNENIDSWGPLYYSGNNICRKCIQISFPIKAWDYRDLEGNNNYYNLGSDIIDTNIDISQYINNKYVVIGDITEADIHGTFMGPLSGAIISINALIALINNEHIINWSSIIIFIIFYTILSFLTFQHIDLNNKITYIVRPIYGKASNFTKPIIHNKVISFFNPIFSAFAKILAPIYHILIDLIKFAIPYIGIGLVLKCVAIICYFAQDAEFNIFIPTFWLGTINLILTYINQKQTCKK